MRRAWAGVMAGVLAMGLGWGQEKQEIPLGAPEEIVKTVEAPVGMKTAITKEKAIELATKYSGFGEDKNAEAKLVLYTDTDTLGGGTAAFGFYRETPTWWVYLPNAKETVKVWLQKQDADVDATKEVKCPMHVAINAETGQFMAAIGDSKEKWVKAGSPIEGGTGRPFTEPKETPTLTVKDILRKVSDHRGETGQFFVRYATMKHGYSIEGHDRMMSTEVPMWVYSVRGALINHPHSEPIGYKGPEPSYTRFDSFIPDRDVLIDKTRITKQGAAIIDETY